MPRPRLTQEKTPCRRCFGSMKTSCRTTGRAAVAGAAAHDLRGAWLRYRRSRVTRRRRLERRGAVRLKAGAGGATIWRWELAAGNRRRRSPSGRDRVISREKLSARLETLPQGALLLRGDSVAFPPGGCAYLHRHQGPGIRCLLEGGIRIDTHGHSTSYGPGSPWYESGPEPVFAQAADRPTRFIRVMILPMAIWERARSNIFATKTKTSRGRRSTKSTPTCRSRLRQRLDNEHARLFDFYVLEPYPTPFAQTVSRLFDPL